jgi:two-component system, NarL family, nitrate/nitrite response regulator NarL
MSTSVERVRILLADDHTLLREALRDLLTAEPDFHVVAEAGDGDSALSLAAQTRPDVVLLDVEMPGHRPVQTVRQLAALNPPPKVIILSMYDDPGLVRELLQIGVYGYLHKGVSRQDLVLAIRGVSRNRQRLTISVPWESATDDRPGALSSREQEVLSLVASALSNRQIAGRLAISEGTVKRHMRNIFAKLGAVSRLDAVNKAAATGTASGAGHASGHGAGHGSIYGASHGAGRASGHASAHASGHPADLPAAVGGAGRPSPFGPPAGRRRGQPGPYVLPVRTASGQ